MVWQCFLYRAVSASRQSLLFVFLMDIRCSTQPIAGKIYTLFPKRSVYLVYVAIFEIGSLICALAPTSGALVGGRAVAGLGASGIFAGGLVIVTTVIPLYKRAIWQGIINSTFAVASVIGPVIGGALTQHVSWRWCFYLNLPIAGFSAITVILFLNVHPAKTETGTLGQRLKNLDGIGFATFTGAVAMLLLALQFGGTAYAWNSSIVIGLFVGFGVTMALFVVWQFRQQDEAMIPPKIFSYRNVTLIFASALFANGPFQTVVYWLPIWFQAVLNVSPTSSGVRYLPTVISDVLTSVIGSGIVMKLGTWNPFLLFGLMSMCIGCALLTTLSPEVSDGHWIGFQILCGVGYSLVISMAHLGVQATLPKDLVPIGATTLLFGMSTSCAVFLAVGQAVFQDRLSSELSQVVPSSVVKEIISVGATQIHTVVNTQDVAGVINAYSDAVAQVFVCVSKCAHQHPTNYGAVYPYCRSSHLLPMHLRHPMDLNQEIGTSIRNLAIE